MTNKLTSNVHFAVTIHPLTLNGEKPKFIILTHNTDATVKSNTYSGLYSSTTDYPENTPVYPLMEAAFDVENFAGPIEVVAVPNAPVAVPYNSAVDATADGGTVATQETPGIVYAMGQHLYDGAYYVVCASDITADELTELSDFLYAQKRVMLVAEVPTVADLKTLSDHVKTTDVTPDSLGNTTAVVNSNTDLHPAVQVVAYASSNMPTDLQHIGNLSQMTPDTTLTGDDYDEITTLNGTTVVNKSDDMMMLNGTALAGNYADQFVHTQYVVDTFTDCLQKYLNRTNFPTYDDDTINEMVKSLQTAGTELQSEHILASTPKVNFAKRSAVPNADVTAREYNYFQISAEIADDIENINGKLDITL